MSTQRLTRAGERSKSTPSSTARVGGQTYAAHHTLLVDWGVGNAGQHDIILADPCGLDGREEEDVQEIVAELCLRANG